MKTRTLIRVSTRRWIPVIGSFAVYLVPLVGPHAVWLVGESLAQGLSDVDRFNPCGSLRISLLPLPRRSRAVCCWRGRLAALACGC